MGTRLGTVLGTRLGTVLGTDLGVSSAYPPAVSSLVGLSGFNTTNRIGSAALAGPKDAKTILLAHRVTTQVNAAYLLDYLEGSGRGWRVWQATATAISSSFAPAAAGTWNESARYYPANYVGKDQVLVAQNPVTSNYIDQWCGNTGESAAKTGAPAACTGFAAATGAAVRFALGCRQNGSAAHTGLTIYAVAAFSATLTPSEIYEELDFFYENGRFRKTGDAGLHVSATNTYNLGEDISAASGSVPSTILDRVGSANLTFYAGSAPGGHSVSTNTPNFAFTNVPPLARDVIIAMGDSMTDGRGNTADFAADAPGYEPLNGMLWMMRQSAVNTGPYDWAELNEPCGTRDASLQDSCVGPWGLLGWEIEKTTGRQTAVINGGVGGSLSSTWVAGQTNYENWINRVAAACSRRNATFRALCIYGGPNDAFQASPPNLQTNIGSLKTNIAARIGAIPVTVQSRLTADIATDQGVPGSTYYPSWATVQGYIAALESADHLLITPPTPANKDGLHPKVDQNYTLALSAKSALQGHGTWPW
jgi:hypothetical protein